MRRVYFDESGNTGQNLLDEADPIFVLGSCSFDPTQELEVSKHFQGFNGPELKFSRLRKSAAGQRAVLDFLRSASVTASTAAAVVIHKPHMVVTKYCDLVIEPSMREAGLDFNERGLNISTANLLATTMPVFLNPKTWSDFLSLFVRFVRERTPDLFDQWSKAAELNYAYLEHTASRMAYYFSPVFLMHDAKEFAEALSDDELDPIAPAYFILADHWGRCAGERFELIADESKVLAKERARFLAFSDPALKPVSAGHDRRKVEFPLKIADIIAVDSTAHRQVQFADILGGAVASAAKARVKSALKAGTFAREVFELCFGKQLIVGAIWPSPEVDPAKLGTDIEPGPEKLNAAAYTAMVLKGHPATRKAGA
jgi:hypothetical protein